MRYVVYWVFLLTIAAAVGGTAAYAARPWYDAAKVASSFSQALPTVSRPTYTPVPSPRAKSSAAVPTATPTIPPFKSPSGRTNFLILGSDNDAKNVAGSVPNTQVIIFVSLDTKHQQIYMVSIPRDLYLQVSGFGMDKIDTAPAYGNSLRTVIATVQDQFHVAIDHYAWVGLSGFINIINTLGGVDVNVAHPMVESDFPDDLNSGGGIYAVRRFFIAAGPQHLDGITALDYVRARHADLIGDFGRSERQQQVLLQVKHKLMTSDISTFPTLIEDMQGEIKTDLLGSAGSVLTTLSLADTILHISTNSIHRYYLDPLRGYTTDSPHTPVGDALIANWPKINALFGCIMSDHAYQGCSNS